MKTLKSDVASAKLFTKPGYNTCREDPMETQEKSNGNNSFYV